MVVKSKTKHSLVLVRTHGHANLLKDVQMGSFHLTDILAAVLKAVLLTALHGAWS